LNQFIDTAPQDVPLTDEEIVAEVKKVRQDEMHVHCKVLQGRHLRYAQSIVPSGL